MFIQRFHKNRGPPRQIRLFICHLELRRRKVMVWNFKEEKGNSHGDGKVNVW